MSLQTWQETLIRAEIDGTAFNNTTTPTTLLPGAARYTLPPNWMDVGRVLRITATGRISNIVTTPGNLAIDVRMGPTSNIIVCNPGSFSLNTTAKTDTSWWAEILMTCRAIGAGTSANLLGTLKFTSESVSSSGVGLTSTVTRPNPPVVGTGFDSTVSNVVDLFGTFSIANAGNSIQLHEYVLEALN